MIAIIGSVICMFDGWVWSLSIGRVFIGIASGFYNVIYGKVITENLPQNLISSFATSHNSIICVGFVVTFSLGSLLPDADDYEGNKEDEYWRVVYALPAPIAVISSLLIFFYFKNEPVNYSIMMGNEEEA